MSRPEPRPALQRAADATVHPVSGRVESGPVESSKQAKKPRKNGATSDSIRSATASDPSATPAKGAKSAKDSGKQVDLDVKVPKALRKKVRAAAKQRKVSPDALVSDILRAALD